VLGSPGGGGGAGSAGSGTTPGIGLSYSITGVPVTYAAGGNGLETGQPGAANTGDGGASSTPDIPPRYAAGGSGVIILSIPTTRYSGLVTGTYTITTNLNYTIIKFTAGNGTYTI
jgi:hypothetical protein